MPLQSLTQTSCSVYPASGRGRALLVLAHGAGAGQQHPFMLMCARGLAARGIDVVTFDFPYMHERRKAPDKAPVLEACFRSVVDAARRDDRFAGHRLFIGGKSMGGRIATHLAAAGVDGLSGVVALGYPLHPPGRPDQLRAAHLSAIAAPVLFVQGGRDAFGTPEELAPVIREMRAPVTLHVIEGADHSFAVRGRPRADAYEHVLDLVATWMADPTPGTADAGGRVPRPPSPGHAG